jgi:hypothetical protein
MAIHAAAAAVSRVAGMAFMAGIFAIVGRILMARSARDSRHFSGLDVEPERAVGVRPFILEMAFLTFPAGPVPGMGKRRAPVIAFMTARAARRPRDDAERLQVPVAIPAFQGPVRPHQREACLIMLETGLVPGGAAVAYGAISPLRSLVKVGMAARAIPVRLQELPIGMALDAADILMEGKEILGRVLEFNFGERHSRGMTVLALLLEISVVGRRMAIAAILLRLLVPMAGVADKFAVPTAERKAGGGVILDFGGTHPPGLRLVQGPEADGPSSAPLQEKDDAQGCAEEIKN